MTSIGIGIGIGIEVCILGGIGIEVHHVKSIGVLRFWCGIGIESDLILNACDKKFR